MDSIFILIPIALIFSAIAIRAFLWAVDNNQYDDLDAAAQSILFDDDVNIEPVVDISKRAISDDDQRE
ncbi:MAG: cbb3-type cytochrome oxidase assembly protein CcoS [Oceanicoccus sp.]